MNLTSEKQIIEINNLRQDKIFKKLMRDDVQLYKSGNNGDEMVLNMGPQHPATHGVLRVLLRLDGETIVKCVPELGYLHRGMEKLAENMTYHEFIPFTDRMDYIAPLSTNVGIALAIETAYGIEIPERAKWIRTLVAELARISSHLMAIGSTCLDLGAMTVFLWTFVEREKLYDIFELITGARMTSSYTRIGGVAHDIDDDTLEKIKKWTEEFPALLAKSGKLVNRNKIFVDRVAGVGVMTGEEGIELGVTGPVLRASGVARDLRKDKPYLIYDQLDFEVKTRTGNDVYSRYMLRNDEMLESAKMVLQIIEKMPKGDIISKDPKVALPRKDKVYTQMEGLIHDFMLINKGAEVPVGETYTAIESPKGEFGFFIVSKGDGQPWKMKLHSPSTANLQALPLMAEGSMIADVVAIIGALDPIMGEADK